MGLKGKLSEQRYLLAVAVAALIFYALFVHGRLYGEINGSFISYGFAMKESAIPFWSPQLSGGYPLYANPEVPMFGILNLMLLLIPDAILAFNLTTLAHMLIAGAGAAMLGYELTGNRKAAAVSGVSYLLTGSFAFSVLTATMPFLYPLAFLPLVFLFAYRAIHRNTLRNSLAAAALLAYQIISGGTMHFLWTLLGVGVFLGAYFLFSLARLKKPEMMKIIAIGAILLIFTAGFSAVKLLPALEFNKLTNRADEVSYDDFIWKHTQITPSKMPSSMLGTGVTMMRTGVFVFLLAAAAFLSLRRKYVLALAAVALAALLIEAGTPLARLVYNLPGYDKTRQVYNVLGIFSLSVSVFAGIGWAVILKKIKCQNFPSIYNRWLAESILKPENSEHAQEPPDNSSVFNIPPVSDGWFLTSRQSLATAAAIALIMLEMLAFGYHIQQYPFERNFERQLKENALLLNISADSDYYRLHLYGDDFVGLSLAKYAVPLGIRMLDWTTGNVWFNDYAQFTAIAGQQNSARLWGIANVKYVASKQPLDISGLELAGEFEECSDCDLKAKYLYKNKEFLPEAYTAQKAALILGSQPASQQLEYQLLLDANFNPATTALISSEALPENLERFGLIILTESPSSSDGERLESYYLNGGIVEPNVFRGNSSLSYETVAGFLSSNNEKIIEAEVTAFEPQKIEVTAKEPGFLVLSEKLYKFNEWQAKANGNPSEKFNANIYSTAVYSDGGGAAIFEYKPRTFYTGLLITLLTAAAAIFLVVIFRRKSN